MAAVGKKDAGLPSNMAAALSYVLGLVSGIVVWAVKKNDGFVRFHSIQSIGLSLMWLGGWFLLPIIPVFGLILLPIWGLLMFVFWLVSLVKAYQGERFELPVVGAHIQRIGKQVGL
ncbi:DUF4870 domain-containing protein [Patescibacteria group bacterium]|nr:DUF4870 domain-containing protein [Patescibacteria group bacterium]